MLLSFLHRQFWLSWKDGKIEFGHGDQLFMNRILDFEDPEPKPVRSLAVDSEGEERTLWEFGDAWILNPGQSRMRQ